MTVHCPDCLEPVDVSPTARDGRCAWCRPSRRHSQPRTADRINGGLNDLLNTYREENR